MFNWLPIVVPILISCPIFLLINRKGASNDLKSLIQRRHFVYLFLLTFWQLRGFLPIAVRVPNSYWGQGLIIRIAQDVAGILMSFTRIRMEPYVWYLFVKEINKCRCRRKKFFVEKVETKEEALCSLTNSALNVELVFSIIVGINSLIDNYCCVNAGSKTSWTANSCVIKCNKNKT